MLNNIYITTSNSNKNIFLPQSVFKIPHPPRRANSNLNKWQFWGRLNEGGQRKAKEKVKLIKKEKSLTENNEGRFMRNK